MRSAVHETLSR